MNECRKGVQQYYGSIKQQAKKWKGKKNVMGLTEPKRAAGQMMGHFAI